MTRLEEYLNTRLANIGLSAAENKPYTTPVNRKKYPLSG